MKKEIWKDIKNYKGKYQVSTFGRVKSLTRTVRYINGRVDQIKERILKPAIDNYGYLTVSLCKNNKKKTITVHKLVLSAFKKKPSKNYECNHKDGDKTNNNLSNLEWVTPKQNVHHAFKNGLHAKKKMLSDKEMEEIKKIYSLGGVFQKDLAEKYGVSQCTICRIVNKILKIEEG